MEPICLADGKEIYSAEINFYNGVFAVKWTGEVGNGGFAFKQVGRGQILDTEFMGRKFCLDIMEHLFDEAEVEYDDSDKDK